MIRATGILPLFFSGMTLLGQDASLLYTFQLKLSSSGTYSVDAPRFLSGFNPNGYTNQPWFTGDGDILVSVRKSGQDQNDIYVLSPDDSKLRQLTRTASSEFSPRVSMDGRSLTVLRQIKSDSVDQQVCTVLMTGGKYASMTPTTGKVGYYTIVDEQQLALFLIDGESNHLVMYNLRDHRTRRVTSSVGRTLLTDAEGRVLYVHKFAPDYWYLKRYHPATMTIDIIAETPGLSEDFALAPDGTIFMGVKNILYALYPGSDKRWKPIGDLSVYGIHQINRLAVSPDGNTLALVASPAAQ